MRRVVLAAAALACACVAPAARADHVEESGAVFSFERDTRIVRTSVMPASLTGSVRIAFRSDAATCGAVGRCGLEGTVSYTAPGDGALYGWDLASDGKRTLSALLLAGGGLDAQALPIVSRVRRAVPGGSRLCADRRPGGGFGSFAGPAGHVDLELVGLLGDTAVAGRCAGPLDEDLADAFGRPRLSRAVLFGGRTELDLGGDRPFTAAGLTGSVRSSLVLRLGRAHAQADQDDGLDGGRHVRRRRVTVGYRVAAVRGAIPMTFTGLRQPGCTPLDSCGATGTATLLPRPPAGTEFGVYAEGPVAVPRGRFLATTGLRPGRPDRRVDVGGGGTWDGGGRDEVRIARPGSDPCTDTTAGGGGLLDLRRRGRTMRVHFQSYSIDGLGLPGRSRCGGPLALGVPLATGDVPLRAFGRRRVTLRLRRGASDADEGWRVRTRPDLVVVLRRTRVVERVVRERD